jgi:hypothetical protein
LDVVRDPQVRAVKQTCVCWRFQWLIPFLVSILVQNTIPYIRVCEQHRLQSTLPQVPRLRYSILHVWAFKGM